MAEPGSCAAWVDVGDVADVVKRKKFVVGEGADAMVVIVHDGASTPSTTSASTSSASWSRA